MRATLTVTATFTETLLDNDDPKLTMLHGLTQSWPSLCKLHSPSLKHLINHTLDSSFLCINYVKGYY